MPPEFPAAAPVSQLEDAFMDMDEWESLGPLRMCNASRTITLYEFLMFDQLS
jgi:hypothetical protein